LKKAFKYKRIIEKTAPQLACRVSNLSPTYADVHFALDGRLVKRCVVPVVPGVGTGPSVQQQPDDVGVTERASVVKRMQPAVVARLN